MERVGRATDREDPVRERDPQSDRQDERQHRDAGAGSHPLAGSLLRLQAATGNRAVVQMLRASGPRIQRQNDGSAATDLLDAEPDEALEDEFEDALDDPAVDELEKKKKASKTPAVLHMDPHGVGHEAPDPTKAPAVIHMDPHGVGHKAPDPTKAPAVIHMDPHGVGHKAVDTAPALPAVLISDATGVAHENREAGEFLRVTKGIHDKAVASADKIIATLTPWAGRVAETTAKAVEADAALNAGYPHWNIEGAQSGLLAAQESAKATAAAAVAIKDRVTSAAEFPTLAPQKVAVVGGEALRLKRAPRWRSAKRKFAKGAGQITLDTITEIEALQAHHEAKAKEALALEGAAAGQLATITTQADAAEANAELTLLPLRRGGGQLWKIVGTLQQKLNKTRAAGGRLPVNGLFDGATEAALSAYQAAAGIPTTGVADVATWTKLDTDAPSVVTNGELAVASKEQAESSKPVGGIHPEVSLFSKGAAVKEVQQRLNNWLTDPVVAAKPPFTKLKVDGSFGLATRSALKAFQRAKGLSKTATADEATWAQLDQVTGPVTTGERKFAWQEEVEGMICGSRARYNWEVKGNTLLITVGIKFTGESGHAAVGTWLKDITDIWNTFKAVQDGALPAREYTIEFKPVKSSSAHHAVRVGKPTMANPNPRSDAANWYVNDTRRGVAPHEFGHLIGLEDEYNRPEEQYVSATGQEPQAGEMTSASGRTAQEVSDDIHAAITANAAAAPEDLARAIAAVVRGHGLTQGGFSRLVAQIYESDHTLRGVTGFARYLALVCQQTWTGDLTEATQPFLVSGQSIMGTMGNMGDNNSRAVNLGALPDHEHPVQPRHLRHLADLLQLAHPGTTWTPVRR
ncbi:MAG: hypothetical protein QOG64_3132 [Acidimicrobiaceae bacterium]|nr:hypothetical protein [Acidimicrobiaceae bacterium]